MPWTFATLVVINLGAFGYFATAQRSVDRPNEPPVTFSRELRVVSELDRTGLRERARRSARGEVGDEPVTGAARKAPSGEEAEGGRGLDSRRETNPELAASEVSCFRVGPVEDPSLQGPIRGWFEAQGASATIRENERREVVLYWVFLPSHESRAQAEDRLLAMRAAGLGDMFIIPRGDMANAISLGLYRQPDSLERRLADMRARGFKPLVAPRYRSMKGSWVDVEIHRLDTADTEGSNTSVPGPGRGLGSELGPDLGRELGAAFYKAFPKQIFAPVGCDGTVIAGAQGISYNASATVGGLYLENAGVSSGSR